MYWNEEDISSDVFLEWKYSICREKLDGTDEQELLETEIYDLVVDGEWMYYSFQYI